MQEQLGLAVPGLPCGSLMYMQRPDTAASPILEFAVGWELQGSRISPVPTEVDHVTRPGVTQGEDRISAITDRDELSLGRLGGLLLSDCRASGEVFVQLIGFAARDADVDPRALSVRTLLHLPRVATRTGWVTGAQIKREISHGARLLRKDAMAVRHLIPDSKFALQELIFTEDFDTVTANKLFSSLHYLRSARPGSRNFALVDPIDRRPVTICSVSPLEWKKVGNQIHVQFGIPQETIWDVSRVYSCDVAPPNAISFLLARVRSSLGRSARNIDLLVTAVDPNLGFTGSSYCAANWQRWLTVQPRPYLYQDRLYASPRQLQQRFGTSNLAELNAKYPTRRFEQSRTRLLDSLIFCCRINGGTETVPLSLQRRLHR